MLHRRHLLKAMAATPAVAAVGALPAWADTVPLKDVPLKDLAAAKGMRFGVAAGLDDSILKPEVSALIVRECNLLVPENELKMYVTHTNATDYNFGPGDQILRFCEDHRIAMRGHNLYWAKDQYTPKWLLDYDFGSQPTLAAEKLLRDYVGTVCDHYGSKLVSWDVVNEAVNEQTGHVRNCVFTRALGVEGLGIAFLAAREHLPRTQLVYNDYMNWEAGDEAHRDGVLSLLRWFRKHNIPVDALGLQSHMGTDHDLTAGQPAAWKSFLDEVTGMGYDLLITEFDVSDKNIKADIPTRDAKVADVAKAYLDLTLSYKQVKDVLCWGLDDKYSWLQGFSKRDDGLRLRPTPYDDDFHPKPLRDAIAAALSAAPSR